MKSTTNRYGHYVHVDNGGFVIAVDVDCNAEHVKTASVVIEDGYYGYSSTKLTLNEKITPENLRRIAEQFILAARALES